MPEPSGNFTTGDPPEHWFLNGIEVTQEQYEAAEKTFETEEEDAEHGEVDPALLELYEVIEYQRKTEEAGE